MKKFFRYFFIVVSSALVLILLLASIYRLFQLHLVSIDPDLFSQNSIEFFYINHLLLAYIHIIPGLIFLILGGYQLIPYFRKKNYKIHRFIGKIFLVLSAIIFSTAIVLALFYTFGDWIESIVTLIFGIFLLFCTYKAYTTAREKRFIEHSNWVTRIYFIALSVSTLRGIIGLFTTLGDDTLQSSFGKSFLIAFVLHTFMVELWIKYLSRKSI